MFKDSTAQFKEYPNSVKNGIIFLITGWICHYYFFYIFFTRQTGEMPSKELWQQVAIGVFICYFVVKIKKWARVLCLLCNAFIIILYLCIFTLFISKINYVMISGANLILFSISSYYLAIKESSSFFKEYNKKDEDSAETIEPEKQNNS
ncbi:MAG: hypothetical protein GY749_45895 [Desulfobacteraceae bacterium]|nr:hypothetical protein [Desulfobacteraceae bacterium]